MNDSRLQIVSGCGGRVSHVVPLPSPIGLSAALPIAGARDTVERARRALDAIVARTDDRLALIIGPAAIHDIGATRDYASRLAALRRMHLADIEIVMCADMDVPSASDSWSGPIHDPRLDNNGDFRLGLRLARRLLIDVNMLTLPTAATLFEPAMTHFMGDLVAWGLCPPCNQASRLYGRLASGLPFPVGFHSDGGARVEDAIDAVAMATRPQQFVDIAANGTLAQLTTTGNAASHLVLPGSVSHSVDDHHEPVAQACSAIARRGLPERVVVDTSRGYPSPLGEDPLRMCGHLIELIGRRNRGIVGAVIKSNLVPGTPGAGSRDDLSATDQSLTVPGIGWDDMKRLIEELALVVRHRRASHDNGYAAAAQAHI